MTGLALEAYRLMRRLSAYARACHGEHEFTRALRLLALASGRLGRRLKH